MSEASNAIAAFKLLRRPIPLAAFLHIYSQATHDCYINYMEGAACLAAYLAPIDIPAPTRRCPDILGSYSLNELSKLLIQYSVLPLTHTQIADSIYEYYTQLR